MPFCSKNEIVTIMSISLVPVSVSVSVNTTVGGANPTIANGIGESKAGTRNAPGSKFFQLHAIFWKIWQNRMFAPPMEGLEHLGENLDPPLPTFP